MTHTRGGLRKHYYSQNHDALMRTTAEADADEGYSNYYVYDAHGQLTRENNGHYGSTILYTYDVNGNITKSQSYAYTTGTPSGTPTTSTYVYDTSYPDRLTSFNGKTISYDANGCVKTYDGRTYSWTRGKLFSIRQEFGSTTLNTEASAVAEASSAEQSTAEQSGAETQAILPTTRYKEYSFTYNAFGQRTKKEYTYFAGLAQTEIDYLKSSVTNYYYDMRGRLVTENHTYTYGDGESTQKVLYFLYEESDVVGFIYFNSSDADIYYYDKNPRGDVVGILDSTGSVVVKYKYDAFGNCSCSYSANSEIADINPIRYRSYYYDVETELYYLEARYYNPAWRRFISPLMTETLSINSVNGLNLYAYANNDPINSRYNTSFMSTAKGGISSASFVNSAEKTLSSRSGGLESIISGLSSAHGVVDKLSSYLVGSIDGLLDYAGIANLKGFQSQLSNYSKCLLGIGIGLDIAESAYTNYHNQNLSTAQKWASFGADIGYIGLTSALSYGIGKLVTKASVSLGTAVAGAVLGTTIGGVTIGIVGSIAIGAAVVVVGVIAGTILIAVLSEALDNLWEKAKKEWFS